MIAALLMLLGDSPDLVARARQVMAIEPRCAEAEAPGDVTVCGRRRADRYRVPLIVHDPGDPRHEGVPAERARLLARTSALQSRGPFLVGGGAAGLRMTTGGRGTHVAGLRPLAP